MRIAIIATVILAAGAAHAEATASVQLILGFSAETDSDETETKSAGGKVTTDGDDEDLEDNFGVAFAYEFQMSERLVVGPRLAFMTGEGDDSENVTRTLDAGGIARYFFNDGTWRGFAGLGAGLTYAMLSNDDVDADGSGVGFHFLLGGGVQGQLSASVGFIGGLYYEYQSVGSIEGDGKVAGTKFDFEVKDATATRPMLMAGVTF